MSLSSLLVHLDGGERSKVRLKVAADLARAKGAKVTGLFLRKADNAEAARAEFLAATARLDAAWIGLDGDDEGELARRAIRIARHFAMIVLGQRRADDPQNSPDFADDMIAHSGRPVLVLPEAAEFRTIGKRPIFAWMDSPSSARGFADGVPLVMPRVEALVVGFSESGDPEAAVRQESLNFAVAHLAAEKICAHAELLPLSGARLIDALLGRAAEHKADLLVTGAFGAASRQMIENLTLPVLLSQ
jgi:nucleotide-binding universal stress UspA family protein